MNTKHKGVESNEVSHRKFESCKFKGAASCLIGGWEESKQPLAAIHDDTGFSGSNLDSASCLDHGGVEGRKMLPELDGEMWQHLSIDDHENDPEAAGGPAKCAINDAEENMTKLVKIVI